MSFPIPPTVKEEPLKLLVAEPNIARTGFCWRRSGERATSVMCSDCEQEGEVLIVAEILRYPEAASGLAQAYERTETADAAG